jgi:hypothetical protein
VIVTETNPVRALEAVMDGFRVMPRGGGRENRRRVHYDYGDGEHEKMKDRAVISNSRVGAGAQVRDQCTWGPQLFCVEERGLHDVHATVAVFQRAHSRCQYTPRAGRPNG